MVGGDGAAAVEISDVVVRYGETTAVGGVSLSVPRGRVLALLGHNGAGKTSLLQVCEGFRRPDAGRARVLGLDPVGDHDALMPRLGIMLQSGGVYPWAAAGEILQLFASFAANPLDTGMLMDRLGLRKVARTRFRRLSGGEQQRLSLAVALVGRPELVFLDEPTAGMDTEARHTTWQLIEELRADGVSVLLTTHLLDEAERLADDVVIMRSGRVAATGTPAELTAAAGIDLLEVRADPGIDLAGLRALTCPEGQRTVTEGSPGEYAIAGELDTRALADVLGWFAGVDAHVTAVSSRRRTLEDVYLSLTASNNPAANNPAANNPANPVGASQ
ncbi:putative ABC transporter ATP-binding protein [Actinoplanes missouriensis 431]|uniref:Putative ABC transporter ATP-binding protein n=1 Tax=Actinoplanes missouriensis (strain ATCC 14538 / DSM 43046 / CBS 188.64 / JCM 3121 / NBRC 102363 / NCIMB 12654 / NRRL B-3342 / UNCC 431) TaxID=512565 RepID=I0HFQ5_ACTM4|nr:ABC transporter ATP-binding protein [Actinoplanes missouriensis]BAL91842.1 putative ABC transporter ATP-binding protein [Actinoplanes missouriensis 431]